MKLNSNKTLIIFIIIFCGALALFLLAFFNFLKEPEELKILETYRNASQKIELFATDPVRGAQNAKITIVEFADFGCEHCKESAAVVRQLLRAYPQDVRIVWKDLPVTTVPTPSLPFHIAAQCANKQGRFWEYHDQLFLAQGKNLQQSDFIQYARDTGLDPLAFEECITKDETVPLVIERNFRMAQQLNLDGVPYFILNNSTRLSGLVSLERFTAEVNTLLEQIP